MTMSLSSVTFVALLLIHELGAINNSYGGLWKWRVITLNTLEQNLRHGHWQSLEVDLASLVTGALF